MIQWLKAPGQKFIWVMFCLLLVVAALRAQTQEQTAGEVQTQVAVQAASKADLEADSEADSAARVESSGPGQYHALLIGVAAQQHTGPAGWNTLATPELDVNALATLLKERYGFKQPTVLLNRDATRETLVNTLATFFSKARAQDSLLLYYSGHGTSGQPLPTWIPYDADRSFSSQLPVSVVMELAKASPARHVLIIADACFSGALISAAKSPTEATLQAPEWYEEKLRHRSLEVFSASFNEQVYDQEVAVGGKPLWEGHSFFAYQLLSQLRGWDKHYLEAEYLGAVVAKTLAGEHRPYFPQFTEVGRDLPTGKFIFINQTAVEVPPPTRSGPFTFTGTKGESVAVTLRAALAGELLLNGQRITAERSEAAGLWKVALTAPGRYQAQFSHPCLERPVTQSFELKADAGATDVTVDVPKSLSQHCGMQLHWTPIEGGTFEMGTNRRPPPRGSTAYRAALGFYQFMRGKSTSILKPVHPVTLKSFWMLQNEVTLEQYQACVEAGVCGARDLQPAHCADIPIQTATTAHKGAGQLNPFTAPNHPVVCVTWNDARRYCDWIGGALPSEAEWEYAARGTDGRIYPWGNETPGSNARVYGNFADEDAARRIANLTPYSHYRDGFVETAPVGSFVDGTSPFGLHDMAGNVTEWVEDCAHSDYTRAPRNGKPWLEWCESEQRIIRGGDFLSRDYQLETTWRNGASPDRGYIQVGFRCVKR